MVPDFNKRGINVLLRSAAKGRTEAIGTTTHLDGLFKSTRIEAAVLGSKFPSDS